MGNKKKYNKRVRKTLLMEEETLYYIQDYCTVWGISDVDFINSAIQEKINKIENSKDGATIHH